MTPSQAVSGRDPESVKLPEASDGGNLWAIGLVVVTLAAALLATVILTGGYTFDGQRVLLGFTAALVLELIIFAPAEHLKGSLRTPLAYVLALLAVWTAASAIWTIGTAGDCIRWGAVTLDYGALAMIGSVVVRWLGISPIAAAISLSALVEGVIGLWAEALRTIPNSSLESDSWRPAGNFQYAPALALLEICALPSFLALACSGDRRRAVLGGFGLTVFGACFGTEDSRLPLALAVVAVIVVALKADRRVLPRRELAGAAILLGLCAVVGDLYLGRQDLGDHPGSTFDLIFTFAGCLLLAVAWPWARRLVRPLPGARMLLIGAALVILTAGIWVAVGYTGTLTSSGGGLDHSRFSYWTSAFDVWKHRPIIGSGAETFFASASHFQLSDDLTLFAHNLPLELAAELGLVGFLFALLLYGFGGRDLWLWLRRPAAAVPGAWLLAPAAGAFLIQNLFDWPWHFAALGAVWALAAGGLSGSLRGRNAAAAPVAEATPAVEATRVVEAAPAPVDAAVAQPAEPRTAAAGLVEVLALALTAAIAVRALRAALSSGNRRAL